MADTLRQSGEHHEPQLTPTEARQSVMTGHMRYVLAISTLLAVVMMLVILVVAPF